MKTGLLLSLLWLTLCFSTQAQIITTVAGTGTWGYSGDGGPATAAHIYWYTASLASNHSGHVYIADDSNLRVRMINPFGIINTIAGNGSLGMTGDGGPATNAQINDAKWIAEDGAGNVYLSGYLLHHIRKISASGIISTFAGIPLVSGNTGDGGQATAATFLDPEGITVDNAGNVYVCDYGNRNVRKIDPSGIITLFAGNGLYGYTGDGGPATAARLGQPRGATTDAAGNVYISDISGNVVRKVNPAGIISTYAGNGVMGFAGDGGPATAARISSPEQLTTDTSGNLYICDAMNARIRKVSVAGIITTVVGGSIVVPLGDGGPATAGVLHHPNAIAWEPDCNGKLYIGDVFSRIRMVTLGNHPPAFTAGYSHNFSICTDTSARSINDLLAIADSEVGQTETWSLLTPASHGTAIAAYSATFTGGILTPAGLSYVPATGYLGPDTFRVTVIDCGNAPDTITFYVTVVNCALAVPPANNQQAALQILPNPSNGSFIVNLASPLQEEVRITITNLTGIKVKELTTTTNKQTTLKLNTPSGIYFITATTAHNTWSDKIVVK
jgi:sugar lactone lactonase YvrE